MALRVQPSVPQHHTPARPTHSKDQPRKHQINPVVANQPATTTTNGGVVRASQQSSKSAAAAAVLSSSGDSSISGLINEQANPLLTSQKHRGVVEKLLHSYGFIESDAQKESHLFFHYSQVVGDVNNLQAGDYVEFTMSYDYRSNRWLGVSVTKIEAALTVSKEQFSGVVLIKAAVQENFKNCLDRSGRISYEQSGETFYIPYSNIDLSDDTNPAHIPGIGNKVTFYIATDQKTGHMWATCVKKAEVPTFSQGVVCSLKENFGFIERADVVKEIFFHYSEYANNIAELVLGDDVQFNIQTRNNKEVATNISKLPEGTVVFEDVSTDKKRGTIAKVIKATRKHAEPLAGAIKYESKDEGGAPTDIPYSERDISGEFTLFVGDVVDFQIAKDRRDGLIHATNVTLCDHSFSLSKEKRDKGVVSSVKESYGFLQILSDNSGTGIGEAQLFFHFNELYESTNTPVVVGDEIEFTIAYDPGNKSKPIAIRIKKLAKGSLKPEQCISSQIYTGSVVQEPNPRPKKGVTSDAGIIQYSANGKDTTVVYMVKDADLRYGDKVSFNICETRRANETGGRKAVNIKLHSRLGSRQGFVCSLKDSFGFIETMSLDEEVFFHYSCYNGDAGELSIGSLVEYQMACKTGSKLSAENVKLVPKSKNYVDIQAPVLTGKVTRTIKHSPASNVPSAVNGASGSGERGDYSGIITAESAKSGAAAVTYPFGVISLCNRRCPADGTSVQFQVAKIAGYADRAVNVIAVKDISNAKVDSIRGQTGYLEVENKEKKIYFRLSDIQDGSTLHMGDSVQCVVVTDSSNRPYAACIRKTNKASTSSSGTDVEASERPQRLKSKVKPQNSTTEGPKVVLVRNPFGPPANEEERKAASFPPRVIRPATGKAIEA